MPARRQHASFEPLPPGFDVKTVVEKTENFQYVDRISCDAIEEQGLENFEKLVLLHVIIQGKPLVVDGYEEKLDPWIFQQRWLNDNHGTKIEQARNLSTKDNLSLTLGHYLRNMGLLAEQYFEKKDNFKDLLRQRMYLKDIDCPPVWQEKVSEHLPAGLFYLNENNGEVGGPGSVDEPMPNATGRRKGRGIAPAGDLMSSLPPEMRAENLMCYIGHEGTYTPAHREMCASLGQNIMVEASGHVNEDGKPERPGSSIWFMTESKDRHLVAEYWLSTLGHDIEVENHFAQVVAWQKAPFKTYVVEQRPGDFILIPPLAPHQVWNRGTRTMKVAWNRTTVETLEMAMREALPNARMVCRDEQYKNKAIIYYTLLKYSELLRRVTLQAYRNANDALAISGSKKVRQLQKDFKRLFELFKGIMLSEMFDAEKPREQVEFLAFDSNVTCAYCRGNIFNRFLTCKTCTTALGAEAEEPYDICMDCFAMGRGCACQSNYKWVEQWKWKDLLQRYEEWRKQVIEIDRGTSTIRQLAEERKLYPKRTLAQVCQDQLKIRPWVDIKQPPLPEQKEDEVEEIQVDDDGNVRKIKKKNKKWLRNSAPCHVCYHRHPVWKMAKCTMCERMWCYGSLWRAHDLHPTVVMEDPQWECPHCRKVCNTGRCRSDTRQRPYQPKGTMLGHDTKKVADVRSQESLVDFGASNLGWLTALDALEMPGVGNPRIERRRQEAEIAKQSAATLDDHSYAVEDVGHLDRQQIEYSPVEEDDIDPALGGGSTSRAWLRNETGFVDPSLHSADHMAIDGFAEVGEDSVAPQFVMYDGASTNEFTPNGAFAQKKPQSSHKRKRSTEGEIKLVPDKRPKVTKPQGSTDAKANTATKQYQVEQERRLIDDARKGGRYIITYAKIKGKSRVVHLRLQPSQLRAILSRPSKNCRPPPQKSRVSNGPQQSMQHNTELIQSDVSKKKPAATTPPQPGQKRVMRYKATMEEDADFRVRVRDRSNQPDSLTNSRRNRPKVRYEEIEVPHYDYEEGEEQEEEILPTSKRARGEGIGELASLPETWKDGRVNKRDRASEAERSKAKRQTLPARPNAGMKAPSLRPPRRSTGDLNERADTADEPEDLIFGQIAAAAPVVVNPTQTTSSVSKRGHPRKSAGRTVISTSFTAVNLAKDAQALIDSQTQSDANLSAKMAIEMGGYDLGDINGFGDEDADMFLDEVIDTSKSSYANGKGSGFVGGPSTQEDAMRTTSTADPPIYDIPDDSEDESSEDDIPARAGLKGVRSATWENTVQ